MSLFDGMAEIFRDTFGETVTYVRAGDAAVEMQGIVDLSAVLTGGLSDQSPEAVEIHGTVSFPVADLPAGYAVRDTVYMRSRTYSVKAILPDGRGMVLMHLERV